MAATSELRGKGERFCLSDEVVVGVIGEVVESEEVDEAAPVVVPVVEFVVAVVEPVVDTVAGDMVAGPGGEEVVELFVEAAVVESAVVGAEVLFCVETAVLE